MYTSFYQLTSDPFTNDFDHRLVYPHEGYANARSYLEHDLMDSRGIVVITGQDGSGKATMVNEVLFRYPFSDLKVVRLIAKNARDPGMVYLLASAMAHGPLSAGGGPYLGALLSAITSQSNRGLKTVLIIEEAQNLTRDGLQELADVIEALNANELKFQVFLLGEPTLQALLLTEEGARLSRQVQSNCELEPMPADVTADFVRHRLKVAGWKADPVIEPDTFSQIHNYTGGVPQRVCQLCRELFQHAAQQTKHAISGQDVAIVAVSHSVEPQISLAKSPSPKAPDFSTAEPGLLVDKVALEALTRSFPRKPALVQPIAGSSDIHDAGLLMHTTPTLPDNPVRYPMSPKQGSSTPRDLSPTGERINAAEPAAPFNSSIAVDSDERYTPDVAAERSNSLPLLLLVTSIIGLGALYLWREAILAGLTTSSSLDFRNNAGDAVDETKRSSTPNSVIPASIHTSLEDIPHDEHDSVELMTTDSTLTDFSGDSAEESTVAYTSPTADSSAKEPKTGVLESPKATEGSAPNPFAAKNSPEMNPGTSTNGDLTGVSAETQDPDSFNSRNSQGTSVVGQSDSVAPLDVNKRINDLAAEIESSAVLAQAMAAGPQSPVSSQYLDSGVSVEQGKKIVSQSLENSLRPYCRLVSRQSDGTLIIVPDGLISPAEGVNVARVQQSVDGIGYVLRNFSNVEVDILQLEIDGEEPGTSTSGTEYLINLVADQLQTSGLNPPGILRGNSTDVTTWPDREGRVSSPFQLHIRPTD